MVSSVAQLVRGVLRIIIMGMASTYNEDLSFGCQRRRRKHAYRPHMILDSEQIFSPDFPRELGRVVKYVQDVE